MAEILACGRTLWQLRRVDWTGSLPTIDGPVWVHGEGSICFGKGVILDAREAPIELRVIPGAQLLLGDDVVIQGGTSIEAEHSVSIGPRVHIGRFAKVMDNHFHNVVGPRHQKTKPGQVSIDADARIGDGAIVLPGANIGERAELASQAVISRRVRPGEHIAGPREARSIGSSHE